MHGVRTRIQNTIRCVKELPLDVVKWVVVVVLLYTSASLWMASRKNAAAVAA